MSDSSFMYDPRKMIGGPFSRCPSCGEQEFGTLSISNNFHTRRCRACLYSASKELPQLKKKLIYLDQMVLSNIAKELDPVWRQTRKRLDPFWIDLFDQLDRLLKLQLLVCPTSPTHEEESSYDSRFEFVLRRLYEHLANGVEFDFPEQILEQQLHLAFTAALEGTDPDFGQIVVKDVLHRDPNEWMDRIRISVNWPWNEEEVDRRRRTRDEGYDVTMKQIWTRWSGEKHRCFDDWFEEERRGIADAALSSYVQYHRSLAEVSPGVSPEDVLSLMPNRYARLVAGFLWQLEEINVAQQEQFAYVQQFLYSEAALKAPQNQISSLLFAGLARRAASGQKRVPNRGTYNDIRTISAYLPYCDAIFVDNEFAVMLGEKFIVEHIAAYPTRIFSARTKNEFLSYLKSIEETAPSEHVDAVRDVYGPDWDLPFRTILEQEREQSSRRQSRPQ